VEVVTSAAITEQETVFVARYRWASKARSGLQNRRRLQLGHRFSRSIMPASEPALFVRSQRSEVGHGTGWRTGDEVIIIVVYAVVIPVKACVGT
jgi:hypothetical protein